MNSSDKQAAPLIVLFAAILAPGIASATPPTEGCTGKRMIGMLVVPSSSYTCPTNTSPWSASSLFSPVAPLTLPAELRAYCLYEWTGGGSPLPALAPSSPDGRGPLEWLKDDCFAVTSFGRFSDTEAPGLFAAFQEQIETMKPLPLAGAPTPTKVVVVDSAVNTDFPDPGTGYAPHGELVGTTIRAIACPDPSLPTSACLAEVSSRLALPMRKLSTGPVVRDDLGGGTFGSYGQLAVAILQGHQFAQIANGSTNIVLNISVGWDPSWGGGYTIGNWMTLDPPMRAVNSALYYAACRQSLIIAAAGNRSGSPNEVSGASFPGRWEGKPAATATRCARLGGLTSATITSSYRPLLYAVAGVAGNDEVLMTAKENSVPSLVAPAAHFAFVDDSTEAGYTGSSAAAAVVSGIAAAVWAYMPTNTSSHDVMAAIRANGVALPSVPVDFCLQTATCPLQTTRVSLCRTIEAICPSSTYCPTNYPFDCPTTGAGRDARPSGLLFTDPSPDTTVELLVGWTTTTPGPPCNGDLTYQSLPADACPLEEYLNQYGSPFSHSFPEGTVCPVCTLRRETQSLLMNIVTAPGAQVTLTSPTLNIVFKDLTEMSFAINVSEGDLASGKTIEVTDLDFYVEDVSKGTIQFVVNGTKSSTDQLIIEP